MPVASNMGPTLLGSPGSGMFGLGGTTMSAESRGDSRVIEKNEPFLVESRLENGVHHSLEVFWSVQRSERETHWQIDSRHGDHREDLTSSLGVSNVVKPPDCV